MAQRSAFLSISCSGLSWELWLRNGRFLQWSWCAVEAVDSVLCRTVLCFGKIQTGGQERGEEGVWLQGPAWGASASRRCGNEGLSDQTPSVHWQTFRPAQPLGT